MQIRHLHLFLVAIVPKLIKIYLQNSYLYLKSPSGAIFN